MSEIAAASAAAGKTVHLVSQEGESFEVSLENAKMSELVKTMIDEEQDDDEAQEIPLPNVKSAILAKVIEFIQRHKTEPMSEIEKVSFFSIFNLAQLTKIGPNTAVINATAIVVTIVKVSIIF